jgi:uncharacterized protein
MTSRADVATTTPARYMKQLCRHFGHRQQAEFDDERGTIRFEFGVCDLAAGGEVLTLVVTAEGGEELERMERVVGSHLERFAHRDELTVTWQRAAADAE